MNMGIDPNNHRLRNNQPRPESLTTSSSATVSVLKCGAHDQQPVKSRGDNCDQVSDAGSSLLEDDSCGLPDLNLDLTVNIPFSLANGEEGRKRDESNTSTELDCSPSPTLLLFR